VPKMVVEKIDPTEPAHGDVPGTAAYEMRKADAEPDVILKAPAGKYWISLPPPPWPRSACD
jgi:hypothetical protein